MRGCTVGCSTPHCRTHGQAAIACPLHIGRGLVSHPRSPSLPAYWPRRPQPHVGPSNEQPFPTQTHRCKAGWHAACLINPALWSDRCCFPHFGLGLNKSGVEREIFCTDLVQKLPELVQSANSGLLFRILRHAHCGAPGLIEGEPERLSRHLNKPGVGRSHAANLLLFLAPHTTAAMPHFRADHPPDSACSSA